MAKKNETETQTVNEKPVETKAAAFLRIAQRRMSNALSAIKLLEGLANKANYDYEPGHASTMISAIRKQTDELEAIFAAGGRKEASIGFSFSGGTTTVEGGDADDDVEGDDVEDEGEEE